MPRNRDVGMFEPNLPRAMPSLCRVRSMMPEPSNTTIRSGPLTASARLPEPPVFKLVTWTTSPPRPPLAKRPAPSAPGNASVGSPACAAVNKTEIQSNRRTVAIHSGPPPWQGFAALSIRHPAVDETGCGADALSSRKSRIVSDRPDVRPISAPGPSGIFLADSPHGGRLRRRTQRQPGTQASGPGFGGHGALAMALTGGKSDARTGTISESGIQF